MALPPPDPQYVLRGTNDAVNTLCFQCMDPDLERPLLFSGSSNGLVHIWDLKTRRVDTTLNGHNGKSVYWVQTLHRRRNALFSQGRDQNICLWDLAEGQNVITDSVFTENIGFCKGSLLELAEGRWLLATPWKGLEEVPLICARAVASNLGSPDVLGLQHPEFMASTAIGEGFWVFKSSNI